MNQDVMGWHPFQGYRLLNDNGIRQAVKEGRIRAKHELEDVQFQPNTLDIRIGEVRIYNSEIRVGPVSIDRYVDPDNVQPDIVYPDEKDIPIVLPPGCFAEIYIHDEVEASLNDYFLYPDLRSSRGRNGLCLYNSSINRDKDGRTFLAVMNHNPNPIKLYGRDRFAQLFFFLQRKDLPYDGHVVANPEEALQEARRIAEGVEMHGIYMQFKMGRRVKRYKTHLPEIDTRKKYDDDEIFDTTHGPFFPIAPGDVSLVDLEPSISLPNDLGLQLIPRTPFVHVDATKRPPGFFIDSHVSNAGWIDSGYPGSGKACITAHPRRFTSATSFIAGLPIVYGIIYKYDNPVLRPYGSDRLHSNYSNT